MRKDQRAAVEAVLTVATEPVPAGLFAELLELDSESVERLLRDLAESYVEEERGFALAKVAGGYRLQSAAAYSAYVERFVLDGTPHKLSGAALETLAVVAYKQPVARSQISAIRGVNADGVLRLLVSRGYVEEVGRDSGPGQPVLFGTSQLFLEKLGLDSLAELPSLVEFVPPAETVERLEGALRPEPDS